MKKIIKGWAIINDGFYVRASESKRNLILNHKDEMDAFKGKVKVVPCTITY